MLYDSFTNPLCDLWDYGVSESSKSVQPRGKDISDSRYSGFTFMPFCMSGHSRANTTTSNLTKLIGMACKYFLSSIEDGRGDMLALGVGNNEQPFPCLW
jgi:hypothetical protein